MSSIRKNKTCTGKLMYIKLFKHISEHIKGPLSGLYIIIPINVDPRISRGGLLVSPSFVVKITVIKL